MARREIRRESYMTEKIDGELGNWALVVFEEVVRLEGELNESTVLSYEIHYAGHVTLVSWDEELHDFQASTFMEMVDAGMMG